VTGAESKDGSKANVRERPLASNDIVERTERTEIEWFSGGHEIHGQGTFAFLKRHLGYPK